MTGGGSKIAAWFWLSACLGAGGVLYLGLSDALPLAGEVTAAAAPKIDLPKVEPVSYQSPALQSFDEIALRPLFSTDRRPYVAPAPPAEPETIIAEAKNEVPAVELVGIMLTDVQRSALFQLEADARLVWIFEGQAIGGWQVETILPRSATLRRGDHEALLELRAD